METGGLVVPSSQKKAKKRPAGGEVNSKIPDGAELHRAVLEFIRNTVAWEEMPLGDFRRKLEQQLNLNEGFQFCFSHTCEHAVCRYGTTLTEGIVCRGTE
jgi:hypothetical protein